VINLITYVAQGSWINGTVLRIVKLITTNDLCVASTAFVRLSARHVHFFTYVRKHFHRKEVMLMFFQTLLISTGTLVALIAVIWSIMPEKRVEQSFVS